jgi:hypothetical protein
MDIEQDIQAAGANVAPRITPADIEANILYEGYFTADQGVAAEDAYMGELGDPGHPALKLLTFCVLVLQNGFTVTGESACASPANFNAEIGRKVARANAVEKMWPLMGYALKEQLAKTNAYGAAGLIGLPVIDAMTEASQ